MFVADSPAAFGPRIAVSASEKSPVEIPFRYKMGIKGIDTRHPPQDWRKNPAREPMP
jgi:hypothetical protein